MAPTTRADAPAEKNARVFLEIGTGSCAFTSASVGKRADAGGFGKAESFELDASASVGRRAGAGGFGDAEPFEFDA